MPVPYLEHLRPLQEQVNGHPIYAAIRDLPDLRILMTNHVFLVWDYVSLIKWMQQYLAPTRVPWSPRGDPALRYFINQLVLDQESDAAPARDGGIRYASQFEFYCDAMKEIGADGERPQRFLALVEDSGLDAALDSDLAPKPARSFMKTTFSFIRQDQPHVVAAALVMGREHLVAGMFGAFLNQMPLGPDRAPSFHYYLNRHLHLNEKHQGPLTSRLLNHVCDSDERRKEAAVAAEESIRARLRFWDEVLAAVVAGKMA